MVEEEKVQEALEDVVDPELDMDIWTLGLVYDIEIEGDDVDITMTLTSPMCPYGPQLVENVKSTVKQIAGAEEVDVEVTFDPPWEPPEEVKMMFGL